jgi:hypothetical protein
MCSLAKIVVFRAAHYPTGTKKTHDLGITLQMPNQAFQMKEYKPGLNKFSVGMKAY